MELDHSLLQNLANALDEQLRLREASSDWRKWLPDMFPRTFSAPFGTHHVEFWKWVEAITPASSPLPFFAIWPRGGAKTTSAESAVVRLAAKKARNFCLYVRSTQDKANESVSNIAAMLESRRFSEAYPDVSSRKLSKYGFARGWRVDTLRCASGFSVVGLGFDAAVRGVKIEDARPDLIIFDDIDEASDSLKAVQKKIDTLTLSILPAGSSNVAILGIQNLIHEGSIFTQIADGTAEFLYHRQVSGPHPAIRNLEYEQLPQGGYRITGGRATWEGQSIEVCQKQINEWGISAFLREAQHHVEQSGTIWKHIEFRHCDYDDVPEIVRGSVWVDPAVTTTDESDSMAIQADGLGVDDKLYRFFSWEQIATPEHAVERAILKALELGLESVGIETDQGGDTWRPTYKWVWEHMVQEGKVAANARMPECKFAKAGAGHGSKVARNQRMLVDYEHGKIIHVRGTHQALERSLKRFPNKPLDLADAAYWGWYDLMDKGVYGGSVGTINQRVRNSNARQAESHTRNLPETRILVYLGQRSFPLVSSGYSWHISPGWSRDLPKELAESIASKFPAHFRIQE